MPRKGQQVAWQSAAHTPGQSRLHAQFVSLVAGIGAVQQPWAEGCEQPLVRCNCGGKRQANKPQCAKCRSAKKKSNSAAAQPAAPLMGVSAGGNALSREGSTERTRKHVAWAADLEQVQMIAGRFSMEEQALIDHGVTKPAAKPVGKPDCPPEVAETVIYSRTGELANVVMVHRDDPDEVYITIQMADGREKQTTTAHLQRVDQDVVAGDDLSSVQAAERKEAARNRLAERAAKAREGGVRK